MSSSNKRSAIYRQSLENSFSQYVHHCHCYSPDKKHSHNYLLSIFSHCGVRLGTWSDLAIEVRMFFFSLHLRGFRFGGARDHRLIDERTSSDFQFSPTINALLVLFSFQPHNSHPSMYADPDFSESRIGWVTMNMPTRGRFDPKWESNSITFSSTKPEMIALICRTAS